MKHTKTIFAAAIFALIALAGTQAQTTTATDASAGTYNHKTLSLPRRLQLADAVVTSGTDASSVFYAANFMLMVRPVVHAVKLFPAFSESVISDPTIGGKIDPSTASLLGSAIMFKAETIPALDDKIAYLASQLSNENLTQKDALRVRFRYGSFVVMKANLQYSAQDYSGAVATAFPVLGCCESNAEIPVIFKAKLALRSPDLLAWAKLLYILQGFNLTQTGIDAVSSAFRAIDTNLVRANAFIQYQKDGTGTNPLAGVTIPPVAFLGTSDSVQALNKAMTGDNLAALKLAVNAFAGAPSGPRLNIATAFVAQWLRNIDGHLVRANQFVSTQSKGQAFTIDELK